MRIIRGSHKGKKVIAPKAIKARPTTDFAKESLFNILDHQISFSGLQVLELFTGTGNISFEFASRGSSVIAIDQALASYRFINSFAKENSLDIKAYKFDVFRFLKKEPFKTVGLVFADPPYHMDSLVKVPDAVLNSDWLKSGGLLILEHSENDSFADHSAFVEHRKYGAVNFTFFRKA